MSFADQLKTVFPELAPESIERIVHYQRAVAVENQIQNLTRLDSETDFIENHIPDCLELMKSGFVTYPAMDIGSGMGVPGLLSAIIQPGKWTLVDSEKRKAEFLSRMVEELGLKDVSVSSERAEKILKKTTYPTLVARAVGPVSRIYGWLRHCSTWNKLILLKSRSWEEEWTSFRQENPNHALKIEGTREYEVGAEKKYRLIVSLVHNVPRRTK